MSHFWLFPRAPGDTTEWTPNPASSNWDNARPTLDPDVSSDPRDTWNEATAAGKTDLFLIDSVPAVDPLTISALDVFCDLNSVVGSFIDVVIKFQGTVYVVQNIHGVGGGSWNSGGAAIVRPGGGDWLMTDFQDLQIGYRSTTVAGGDTLKACASRLRVTYDPRPSSTPEDGTRISAVAAPDPDPRRFTLDINLTTADKDVIDDAMDSTALRVLGPIELPGQLYPVFLTLSQESVINHP